MALCLDHRPHLKWLPHMEFSPDHDLSFKFGVTSMSQQMEISLAFSPDTDDAFMVHAIEKGLVDTGDYRFKLKSADIQYLNEMALKGIYDVTAISIAVYPLIQDHYHLMPVGSSIGDGFGPAVVVSSEAHAQGLSSIRDLKGKRIAVPGLHTSAYIAARMLIGPFEPVPTLFSEITKRVAAGECDGGILIHELQLWDKHPHLVKIGDLGRLWFERFELPLPLGGNGIRRSLGQLHVERVTEIFKQSIIYGFQNRESTLEAALYRSGAQISITEGERYISMYVNDNSLTFAPGVQKAIELLLTGGADLGLCPPLTQPIFSQGLPGEVYGRRPLPKSISDQLMGE
jgi:1,4-dihydroxy-6-naphthoate synthase